MFTFNIFICSIENMDDYEKKKMLVVDDDAHDAIKSFCKQNGLIMRTFVSNVLLDVVNNNISFTGANNKVNK